MLESSGAAGPSGSSTRSGLSTPPMTPSSPSSAPRARRIEDYEMDDSPRHSRESSRSLLSGHERSSSIDSLQLSGNGTGKAYPSSLKRIDEDGILSEEDEEEDDPSLLAAESQKIRRDKHKYYDDDTSDELPTSRSRRASSFSIAASRAKSTLQDNRGILMIIVSQACFAGMNVMVSLTVVHGDFQHALTLASLIILHRSSS